MLVSSIVSGERFAVENDLNLRIVSQLSSMHNTVKQSNITKYYAERMEKEIDDFLKGAYPVEVPSSLVIHVLCVDF